MNLKNKTVVFLVLTMLLLFSASFLTEAQVKNTKENLETKQSWGFARVGVSGTGPWPNFGGAGRMKFGFMILGPSITLDSGCVDINQETYYAPLTLNMDFYLGYWSLSPISNGARIGMGLPKGNGFGVSIS